MANDDKDLPLMSNTDDMFVEHYVLFLKCNLVEKYFDAKLYLFLRPTAPFCKGSQSQPNVTECAGANFILTLDSKDIEVERVDEIILELDDKGKQVPEFVKNQRPSLVNALNLEKQPRNSLGFVVEEWCLKIWKAGIQSGNLFPRIVYIQYRTTRRGTSITWIKDQDNRDCCFTHGAWINNRSLLPCQEPPMAMATWQAFITCPKDALVIMSGDEEAHDVELLDSVDCGLATSYFYTRMVLPISTLALAIGFWKALNLSETEVEPHINNTEQYCYSNDGVSFEKVKCRLIAPQSLLEKAYQELGICLKGYLQAVITLLGPYPFRRLDLVVMPRCFDSLGMANPNVTFVSQCLLAGDGSMQVHLAHELAHAWFGLLIGALNWTEEWLSEGFATYLEDLIHVQAMKWDAEDANDWCTLRAYLRFRTLTSEIQVTDSELQILRPNQESATKATEIPTIVYVKNGMNPEKRFVQVHYLKFLQVAVKVYSGLSKLAQNGLLLKGYFLLRYLSERVGEEAFANFLKNYIGQYHGQLVESKEILKIFIHNFPNIRNEVSAENLFGQWLDNSGLPVILRDYKPPLNHFYNSVLAQLEWWKRFNKAKLKSRKVLKTKKHKDDYEELAKLNSEQTVLLLELLLEEPSLSSGTMRCLCSYLNLESQNAHIRHRWCELVIKHNYSQGLTAVKTFLTEDQGMGVYLYGELMVSGRPKLQKLARDCMHQLQEELSPPAMHVVQEMLQDPP